MRINAFIARATGVSRRHADSLVRQGRVTIGSKSANLGDIVDKDASIKLDGKSLAFPEESTTLIFNKPLGYVVSHRGQGSQTIYNLLPPQYHRLQPIGRLDKNSSGLILLTNDGSLAQFLTHPKEKVAKIYRIGLNVAINQAKERKAASGVMLEDGISKIELKDIASDRKSLTVVMHEGRKRQIRRTFTHLGLEVTKLERLQIGPFNLGNLNTGEYREASQKEITDIVKLRYNEEQDDQQ